MNLLCQRSLLIVLVVVFQAHASFYSKLAIADDAAQDRARELAASLSSAELSERRDAAYALAKLGADAFPAIDALVEGLRDRDDQVWMQCAMAVARLGPDGICAVDALVNSLGDDDLQHRYRAAWAISRIGPQAIPALIKAAADASSRRRAAAFDAMGWMPENADRLVESLRQGLRDDRTEVRQQAATSLARIGDPVASALGEALDSEDQVVRSIAAGGLAKTRSADSYRDRLIALLNDEDAGVRAAAIMAAAKTNAADEQKIQMIIQALIDPDTKVRGGGVLALRGLPDSLSREMVSHLAQQLESDDQHVRDCVAFAIGTMGRRGEPAVDALIAALKDNSEQDASSEPSPISEALRRIGTAAVPALLREATGSQDSQDKLAKALAQIGPAATEPLIAALQNETGRVRAIAAQAIGQMRSIPAIAVQPLANCLQVDDPELRAAASAALGHVGKLDANVINQLRGLSEDADDRVRSAATLAVATTDGDQEYVTNLLMNAVQDASELVRRSAVVGLTKIESDRGEVIDALVVGLSDSDSIVRRDAAIAIGAIGPSARRATERLIELLAGDDNSVRAAAATSLGSVAEPTPELAQTLGRALVGDDDAVSLAALGSLTLMEQTAGVVVDSVIELLSHPRGELRAAALSCLAKIEADAERSVPLLKNALGDEEWAVRRDAAAALGQLGDKAQGAVPVLFALLSEPDDTNFAKDALRSINVAGPDAVPVLIEGLKSTDRRQQFYALYLIGRVQPKAKDAIPVLRELAESSDSDRLRGMVQRAIDEISAAE